MKLQIIQAIYTNLKSKILFGTFMMSLLCATNADATNLIEVKILKISDGDSFHASYDNLPIRVRLYGIDAPERKQINSSFSENQLKEILKVNESYTIEVMDVDAYGRYVGIAYVGEGETAQQLLLEEGNVWLYPRYCKASICYYWENLEEKAKNKKLGIWKDKNPTPPWEFKR